MTEPIARAAGGSAGLGWVRGRLAELGKQHCDLASELGCRPELIAAMLSGRRCILLTEIPAISRVLELPIGVVVERISGERGYLTGDHLPGPASRMDVFLDLSRSYRKVFAAMAKHGFLDLREDEIDDYAVTLAQFMTVSGFESRNRCSDPGDGQSAEAR